jgi:hypothetical protein
MENTTRITRHDYGLIAVWAALLLICYAVVGTLGAKTLRGYKEESAGKRRAFLATTADGRPAGDPAVAGGPVPVSVGIYVNKIADFQLRDASWSADFDVWFRWTGDGIAPGETFQVVDAQVDARERTASSTQGNRHYERYHIQARIEKVFDPTRYPFASEGLGIQVENTGPAAAVRYVTDDESARVDPEGLPPVLRLVKTLAAVRIEHPHSEGNDFSSESEFGRARFMMLMLVSPIGSPKYLMMFQALFASVLVAALVFFIKPTHVDPRFGLGVGAFFAVVGNNIAVASQLPSVDRVTLVSLINGIGLMTVFLTIVQSTISLYLYDSLGRESLSRVFDKVSLVVILVCFIIINVVLPRTAAM